MSQSTGRRLSVFAIDQILAGASNLLTAVLAARVLGQAAFGFFGIVFLVYVIGQGVSRALINDPLLVHPHEAEERAGDAIGSTVVTSTGMASLIMIAGIVAQHWQHSLGNSLIVLGLSLPLLAMQDVGRYLGFAIGRPSNAVVLDAAWLVLLIAAVAVLLGAHARTLTWFITAWAGTGAATGLLTFWQHRHRRIQLSFAWLRHTWMFSWRYLISYTSTQGAALAGSSAVGGIAGAKALGAVQGTILLVRPFGTIQIAAVAGAVSEISRSRKHGLEVRRFARRTSMVTTAVAVINGAIMLALPDRLGRLVLGATWHAARPLLLATTAQIVCLGVITGARSGLLGMRGVRRTVVIDVTSTILVLVGTVVGALIHGVLGALWAVALAQAIMATVWWIVLWSYSAHYDPNAEPAVDQDAITEPLPRLPAMLPPTA